MKDIFLILGSVLTFVSVAPYIWGILRGKVKPNIVSWITWTLLTGLATAAEIVDKEYRTAIFTGVGCIAVAIVVTLGLIHGYVKYSRFDYICQFSVLLGLALWWFYDSPEVAIVAAVVIDLIGTLPTLRHSWNQPGEESAATFSISALSALLAVLALTDYNWSSLSFPAYLVGINLTIAFTIIYRGITHKNYKPSKTARI
jgi:hypothetical protein